ncbi:MAG: hypothetical protein ACYC91_11325 [Solirubrobacteraceae bacterium]
MYEQGVPTRNGPRRGRSRLAAGIRADGGYPGRDTFTLTGAGQLQAMLAGHVPQPPVSRLTGSVLSAFGDGTATFEMPTTSSSTSCAS